MKIPIYNEDTILEAIEEEGLAGCAYGYKTPFCIFIFIEGMEKDEIWEKFPTPLIGLENAHYDMNTLEPVKYFMIDKGPCFEPRTDSNVSGLEESIEYLIKNFNNG